MFHAEIEKEIDAGHFLKLGYPSKCSTQHGHRWKFKAYIISKGLNESGMIVDFTAIKEVINSYDHQNFNKLDEFKERNPTAENICLVTVNKIQEKLDLEMNKPVLYKLEIAETPSTVVRWELDID